ncbi:hypothetical protein SUGI_0468180 [Cryptomeria japonica]|nr:hypothetical protein SUGI_0468180 [Cryptomeria japonica]
MWRVWSQQHSSLSRGSDDLIHVRPAVASPLASVHLDGLSSAHVAFNSSRRGSSVFILQYELKTRLVAPTYRSRVHVDGSIQPYTPHP